MLILLYISLSTSFLNKLCFLLYAKYMTIPISIHIPKRSQLSIGKEAIIKTHTIIPNIGIKGTKGVLKGLSTVGFFLRRTITPIQTSVKANNVPILTMCPKSEIGTKPANMLTKIMNIRFVFQGVCRFDKSEKILGSNPSLLIV